MPTLDQRRPVAVGGEEAFSQEGALWRTAMSGSRGRAGLLWWEREWGKVSPRLENYKIIRTRGVHRTVGSASHCTLIWGCGGAVWCRQAPLYGVRGDRFPIRIWPS